MSHERLSYRRGLLALFILFYVSDILVDEFWLLVVLVSILEDLGVFTHLHIKLIVIIIILCASPPSPMINWHVFSFDL